MSSAGCVARSGTTEHLINSEFNPEKIPQWTGIRTSLQQAATLVGSLNQIHGSFLHGHSDFFFNGKKYSITQAACSASFGTVYHYYGFYPSLVEQTQGGPQLPQKPFKNIYHSGKLSEPHARIEDWDNSFANSGTKTFTNAALPSDTTEQYTLLTVGQNSATGAGVFEQQTGEYQAENDPYRTKYLMRIYTGCSNSNVIYIAGPVPGAFNNFAFSEPLGEGQTGPLKGMQVYWDAADSNQGTPNTQSQSGGGDRLLITEVEDTGNTATLTAFQSGGGSFSVTSPILKITLDTNVTLGSNISNGVYVSTIGTATQGNEGIEYIFVDSATDVAQNKGDANTYSFVHPTMLVKKIIWEQY